MGRNRSFSITQFLTDLAHANPHAGMAYIPSLGREMLYSHQITTYALSFSNPSPSNAHAPYALTPRSLFVSGVIDTETSATRIHGRLVQCKVLDEYGQVQTVNLDGKKFAAQVRSLTISRARELADLLFWWEEECMRLRNLIASEKELSLTIKRLERRQSGDDGDNGEGREDRDERDDLALLDLERLKFEREKLRMRIRQRPSERREDVETGNDTLYDQVQRVATHTNGTEPSNGSAEGGALSRRRTEPAIRPQGQKGADWGKPPAYRP